MTGPIEGYKSIVVLGRSTRSKGRHDTQYTRHYLRDANTTCCGRVLVALNPVQYDREPVDCKACTNRIAGTKPRDLEPFNGGRNRGFSS